MAQLVVVEEWIRWGIESWSTTLLGMISIILHIDILSSPVTLCSCWTLQALIFFMESCVKLLSSRVDHLRVPVIVGAGSNGTKYPQLRGICIYLVLVTGIVYRVRNQTLLFFNIVESSLMNFQEMHILFSSGTSPVFLHFPPQKSPGRPLLEHHRSLRPRADGVQDLFEGLPLGYRKMFQMKDFTMMKGRGW